MFHGAKIGLARFTVKKMAIIVKTVDCCGKLLFLKGLIACL
jgi:hypothetical protein